MLELAIASRVPDIKPAQNIILRFNGLKICFPVFIIFFILNMFNIYTQTIGLSVLDKSFGKNQLVHPGTFNGHTMIYWTSKQAFIGP